LGPPERPLNSSRRYLPTYLKSTFQLSSSPANKSDPNLHELSSCLVDIINLGHNGNKLEEYEVGATQSSPSAFSSMVRSAILAASASADLIE